MEFAKIQVRFLYLNARKTKDSDNPEKNKSIEVNSNFYNSLFGFRAKDVSNNKDACTIITNSGIRKHSQKLSSIDDYKLTTKSNRTYKKNLEYLMLVR